MSGKPGSQTWSESVRITCCSPEVEAARKAQNERIYAPRREPTEKAKTEKEVLRRTVHRSSERSANLHVAAAELPSTGRDLVESGETVQETAEPCHLPPVRLRRR
ncbi:hypothetical protein [Streptomyces sp. NPDC026589]|uniref:hypothetical protein n=1 Tax=Streptomyces sp. NPDC026589 TaxID=3155609 RepID=UPI0033D8DA51